MLTTDQFAEKVQEHYVHNTRLEEEILSALAKAGKDPNHLNRDDLALLDEFHVRGRPATIELAQKLDLAPSKKVLDVGSGLGGPARYLASTYGCHVTGLDLTEAFCRAASMLADRLNLNSLVTFRQGSALEMPFENSSFDVVWTQHAQMNIADKPKLYAEIRRVLKAGGHIALYDILAGPVQPVYFPVPWARMPELSFLIDPQRLRTLLEGTGFRIIHWQDKTELSWAALRDMQEKILSQKELPPVGLQIFLGQDLRQMMDNVDRNFSENRIVVVEAVAEAV